MRLVILGRDGVINEDSADSIKSPDEWLPIPGSLEAIARLNRADCRVVVATNQSGVARGLFTLDMLNRIHDKMHRALAEVGACVDATFYCPHGPEDRCTCRKPQPGMLHDIERRLGVSLHGVPVIGDALPDLQAAAAVAAAPILVLTGKGQRTLDRLESADNVPVFADLAAAVDALLAVETRA